jgi:hypothetical protein
MCHGWWRQGDYRATSRQACREYHDDPSPTFDVNKTESRKDNGKRDWALCSRHIYQIWSTKTAILSFDSFRHLSKNITPNIILSVSIHLCFCSRKVLCSDDERAGVLFLTGWMKGFFFPFATASRLALSPTQPPIQRILGLFSLRIKRPGREADHSPPSTVKVKNAWSYTTVPSVGLDGVVLSLLRDTFTFTRWRWMVNFMPRSLLGKNTKF